MYRSISSAIFLLVILTAGAVGQTTEFTYQGSLQDAGTAANGNYDFEFRLYDAAAGGSQIGGAVVSRNNVAVTSGVFWVAIDFGTGLGGPNFPGADRYLDIRVRSAGGGAFTVLSPRKRVNSSPYAVQSLNAATATNASQLGGLAASQYVVTSDPRMTDARPPTPGSGNYVQNTTTQQATSNFNVSGDGTVGGTLRAGVLRATSSFNIGVTPVLSIAGANNTFVGANAGSVNTGSINAFFGTSAGASNSSGSSNAFFGSFAGESNTTGGGNSFFGRSAGANNSTGANNSFFGSFSGDANTTGVDNSFFGRSSGGANTSGSNNAFFGANSGESNSTGFSNAFFGKSAGASNTTGGSNSFFGRNAGTANTTGSNNAFYGINSGAVNSTGTGNSFFGASAGVANSTANDNSFFGFNAGLLNSIGASNSFFGANAGDSNTSGSSNSFFGKSAGQANTTGISNSFFGINAGAANTASNNAFFGANTGSSNTTGSGNAFYGSNSGVNNLGASDNSFFGSNAGQLNSTGSENSFFGRSAGRFNTGGSSNSFFGMNSGVSNITGSNNTLIGNDANVGAGNLTFATALGAGAVVSNSNSLVLGRSADHVRIPGGLNVAGQMVASDTIFADGDILLKGILVLEELGDFGVTPLCRNPSFLISTCLSPVQQHDISDLRKVSVEQAKMIKDLKSEILILQKTLAVTHELKKTLTHPTIQSSELVNIYSGNAATDANGEAFVQLPAYIEALNKDFRYQLTVLGTFAQAIVADEIAQNTFKIKTDKPNVKVSWQVTGVRKDAAAKNNRVPVEQDKTAKERESNLMPTGRSPKKER